MDVLGISLATVALLSLVIFQLGIKGGVSVEMTDGHVKTFKGQEYTTELVVRSVGAGWTGSTPTRFEVESGQSIGIERLSEEKVRLHFLGKYAGRVEGIKVGIDLTDPLMLMSRVDEIRKTGFILDTYPLSLARVLPPRRVTIFGSGDQPTGYAGAGQELYGLEEYQSNMETKDILWKRVAKTPEERLISRLREATVRDVLRIGVMQFAERKGDAKEVWIDSLCEALGLVGREVFEIGASVTILFDSRRGATAAPIRMLDASETVELAEAVMSCSVAPRSRDIEAVVANSDLLVTGLLELGDERVAKVARGKRLLLINEKAPGSPTMPDGATLWTGTENLFPLVRKMLES